MAHPVKYPYGIFTPFIFIIALVVGIALHILIIISTFVIYLGSFVFVIGKYLYHKIATDEFYTTLFGHAFIILCIYLWYQTY